MDPASATSLPVIPGIEDLEVIGRGGFGVVYRGRQPVLGREVAVKVVLSPGAPAGSLDRWRREITAMGRLSNHPNIVAVYAGGVSDDGLPYLVMPFVPGGSLRDRLREHGPIPPVETAAIGARLAGALAIAHEAGVLHRDVKPENVLQSPYGEPQLADFGVARLLDAHATTTGNIHATVPYAPPEVLSGGPATEATDVYGLGATLFACLTGQAPFPAVDGQPLIVLATRVTTDPPPDLRAHGVPDALAAVIERMLAKDPADRYPSAAHAERALAEVAAGGTPSGTSPPAAPPRRRPRALRAPGMGSTRAALLAGLALAALIIGAALMVRDEGGGGTPSAGASTTTAATAPVAEPDAQDMADTAQRYFANLGAGDLAAAWAMTSPGFQAAQSRSSYEAFWSGFGSIEVVGEPVPDETTGDVTVTLALDGRQEAYTLELVAGADGSGEGAWLVDGPTGG